MVAHSKSRFAIVSLAESLRYVVSHDRVTHVLHHDQLVIVFHTYQKCFSLKTPAMRKRLGDIQSLKSTQHRRWLDFFFRTSELIVGSKKNKAKNVICSIHQDTCYPIAYLMIAKKNFVTHRERTADNRFQAQKKNNWTMKCKLVQSLRNYFWTWWIYKFLQLEMPGDTGIQLYISECCIDVYLLTIEDIDSSKVPKRCYHAFKFPHPTIPH